MQKPARTGRGWKLRCGRSAWCRRWRTASKEDVGTVGRRWVRKKSLNRLKDKIRERTRRAGGQSLARIIEGLNPILKGWFAYFQHAHPYTFQMLDGFIRRRLRSILLRQKTKQSCYGMSRAIHQRWPNSFFAEAGLLALHTAWLNARHSR